MVRDPFVGCRFHPPQTDLGKRFSPSAQPARWPSVGRLLSRELKLTAPTQPQRSRRALDYCENSVRGGMYKQDDEWCREKLSCILHQYIDESTAVSQFLELQRRPSGLIR